MADQVKDVATLVGFANFYAQFIPQFEPRIKNLRELIKNDMKTDIQSVWTSKHEAEMKDIINAILSEPCLKSCLNLA